MEMEGGRCGTTKILALTCFFARAPFRLFLPKHRAHHRYLRHVLPVTKLIGIRCAGLVAQSASHPISSDLSILISALTLDSENPIRPRLPPASACCIFAKGR